LQPNLQLIFSEIKQGNQQAFEKFFKMFYAPLCGFALGFLGDRDEAEELVQDTFVKLWEKRDEISIETSLKSYLYSSVRNACFNYLKHLKVRQAHAAEEKHFGEPTEEITANEVSTNIDLALSKLPEKCREVFELSRFKGMKYQEIAEYLNISVKTVENQMGKALKVMRVELAEFLTIVFILIVKKFL